MKCYKVMLFALCFVGGLVIAANPPISVSLHNSFVNVPAGMDADQLANEFATRLQETKRFKVLVRGRALDNQNNEIALTVGGNATAEITQADYTAECHLVLDGRIMKFSATLNSLKNSDYPDNFSVSLRAFCEDHSLRASIATELLEQVAKMLASDPETRLLKAVELQEIFLKEQDRAKAEKMRMQAADWANVSNLPALDNIPNKQPIPNDVVHNAAELVREGLKAQKEGKAGKADQYFFWALKLLNLSSFEELKHYDAFENKPVIEKNWKIDKWNLTFRWIPPGKTRLPGGKEVSIRKGYWITEQPVSRYLYQIFIAQAKLTDSFWNKEYVRDYYYDDSPFNKECVVKNDADRNKPMIWIKFAGADAFAKWLSQNELSEERNSLGMEYKLPSYEEWFYAAKQLGGFQSELGSEWTRSIGESGTAIAVTNNSYGEKSKWREDRGFRLVLTQK